MAADAERSSGSNGAVRVVLVDDHTLVRSGLRALLERRSDVEVVGEAGDVDETLQLVQQRRPHVVVLDLYMRSGTSLTAIPDVVAASPSTRVVVLTMHTEPDLVRQALRSGASAYVVKEAADAELIFAIRAALAGSVYVSPGLGAELLDTDGAGGELSAREVDVLRLIARGYTNKEIAEVLFLSVRTVESHRARIQAKLKASTRHELVEYALRHGLVQEAIDGDRTGAVGNGH